MNFDRGYRFFLKVAFVFLVASILLPFAFETMIMRIISGPPVDPNRTYRDWGYYWSFMYVRMTAPVIPDQSSDGVAGTFWLFPPRYWEYRIYPSSSSNPLGSMFVLQIALLLLGFITLKKARRAWSLMPFFLGILALDALYWHVVTAYYRSLSFGFWVLVVATLFISIALMRAKNWM